MPFPLVYDLLALQRLAAERKPEVENNPQSQADAFLVCVLPHDKHPTTCASDDFLWFKVKAKHSVAKLIKAYHNRTNTDVELSYGNQVVNKAIQLQNIDQHQQQDGDCFLLLTAHCCAPGNTSNIISRRPLEPVTIQLDSAPQNTDSDVKPNIKNENQYSSSHDLDYLSTQNASTISTGTGLPTRAGTIKREDQSSSMSPGAPLLSSSAASGFFPRCLTLQHGTPSIKAEDNKQDMLMGADDKNEVQPDLGLQNTRLRKLIDEAPPDVLEAEVQSSQEFLKSLEKLIADSGHDSQDTKHWLQQLSALQKHDVNTPTIIGVVGNTGAGKSSVINAILDEERIVPTNCMRACTAVVTRISWNSSDVPSKLYRGEIEFIDRKEWEHDLRLSLAELKHENGGISREYNNPDSEAGIAYAKIKAVYPQKTKDQLASCTVEELMREPAVHAVLGTTKTVENGEPEAFYKSLQHYVDSKEKSTGDKKKKENGERKQMEFWPLIKVVRVYTKAEALSTGAIVVDLPGVHDSNAARSAVAARFLKQCTGLWIVAPIGRAVDDKAAKNLLGESFKRQLKYDGIYSKVTFICSKTDDISITEASESLGLEEEMAADWEQIDEIDRKKRSLKQEIENLLGDKADLQEVLSGADDQIEAWEDLRASYEVGKKVWAPSNKRNRSESPDKPRKKAKTSKKSEANRDNKGFINNSSDEGDESEGDDASDKASNVEENDSEESSKPLTVEAIDKKLEEFKDHKKQARRERVKIDEKLKPLRKELSSLDKTKADLEAQMSSVCIEGRNNYSRGAIQTDFAAGIKELDQENAQEDEESFNHAEDLRDYDEVAQSLPVFCVSSRAYQKLSGRMQRDADVPGFRDAKETEIPQLKAHCKRLTENGRTSNCRRFLTDLSQFLNSITLWTSINESGLDTSSSQIATESQCLKTCLQTLDKKLSKAVEECLEEMKQTLAENIFDNYENAVAQAVSEATTTSTRWGDRHMGGFYWATYKALCRRQGVFTNAQGPHDLNLQLTEPIIKGLANNWEKAFARRLPTVLQSFSKKGKKLLVEFHSEIASQCVKNGVGIAGILMLQGQLQTYEGKFMTLAEEMKGLINESQREANREFTPTVASWIASSYEFCAAEVGIGQYMRMKAHMNEHIATNKDDMFQESVDAVKKRLVVMCQAVEESMSNKAKEIWSSMNRDYTQVVTGTNLANGEQVSLWEVSLKSSIAEAIRARGKELLKAEEALTEAKIADTSLGSPW